MAVLRSSQEKTIIMGKIRRIFSMFVKSIARAIIIRGANTAISRRTALSSFRAIFMPDTECLVACIVFIK